MGEGESERGLYILVRPSHVRLRKRPPPWLLLAANPVRHTRHISHRAAPPTLSSRSRQRAATSRSSRRHPRSPSWRSTCPPSTSPTPLDAPLATVATMDVEMNEADSLEALSGVLERLTDDPYDISLHAEHIRIARATGMDDQVDSALEMMTAFWASGDGVWLLLIQHKIAASDLESPEDLQSILDLFARAEQDYLCE